MFRVVACGEHIEMKHFDLASFAYPISFPPALRHLLTRCASVDSISFRV